MQDPRRDNRRVPRLRLPFEDSPSSVTGGSLAPACDSHGLGWFSLDRLAPSGKHEPFALSTCEVNRTGPSVSSDGPSQTCCLKSAELDSVTPQAECRNRSAFPRCPQAWPGTTVVLSGGPTDTARRGNRKQNRDYVDLPPSKPVVPACLRAGLRLARKTRDKDRKLFFRSVAGWMEPTCSLGRPRDKKTTNRKATTWSTTTVQLRPNR